jgi:PUA domain protein
MRRQLSKKVFKGLLNVLEGNGFKLIREVSFKGAYSVLIRRDVELVYSGDGIPLIVEVDEHIIPFIGSIDLFSGFKKAYVDSGAVRPITNGADVMAPGIRGGDFETGDYVVVLLESLNAPLAIGKSLVSFSGLGGHGKAIENIHYKGDRIWRYVFE